MQGSEDTKPSNNVTQRSQDSINIPDLMALLRKLEGLPEALMMATDALVKETVQAQAKAEKVTKQFEKDLERFERDRNIQLDNHKEAFDSMKGRIDALHQKWVVAHSEAMRPGVTDAASLDLTNGILRQVTPTRNSSKEREEDRKAKVAKQLTTLRQGSVSFEDLKNKPSGSALARGHSNHTVGTQNTMVSEETSRSSLRRLQVMGYGNLAAKLTAPVRMPTSQRKTLLAKLVAGDEFNGFFSLVIIINTIVLGIETNYSLTNTMEHPDKIAELGWAKAVNITLTSLFIVELILRVAAEQLYFILGESRLWNLFDTAMVCTALMDEIVSNVGGNNISFFRVIKILKMGRAVRIFRVFRFIRDLRVMVTSLVASLISLAWALVLLAILIYCSSVLLCQGVVEHFRENQVNAFDHAKFEEFYGSLGMTMYTHVMAISGGLDWYALVYPLNIVSRWHAGLFTFYILFVVFGMLNVLTGVFVDRASELSHMDRDLVIESQKRKVREICMDLKKIFDEIDVDHTGFITWKEFKQYSHREDVLRYMAIMDMNIEEARELFHMFDIEGTGNISIDNFIEGCMRVKGHARNLDVLHIQEDVRKVKDMVMVIGEQLNSFIQLEQEIIAE